MFAESIALDKVFVDIPVPSPDPDPDVHTWARGGGERGIFPPSKGQKPTPYPKAENWLPSKKIFDSSSPLRQKIRQFDKVLLKKCQKWAKKGAKFSV